MRRLNESTNRYWGFRIRPLSFAPGLPIDAVVRYKRIQRRLRLPDSASVFGGGLLDRARSTTLALLGVTAAVGLAMVALALNQSWPLLADSPIPAPPSRHGAVGGAMAVAPGGPARATRSEPARRAAPSPPVSGDETGGADGPAAVPIPGAATEPAVVVSVPSQPPESPPPRDKDGDRPQPADHPVEVPVSTPPSPSEPDPVPVAPPPPAESPPPLATTSAAPAESYVPSWSNGKGHAYGRSGD